MEMKNQYALYAKYVNKYAQTRLAYIYIPCFYMTIITNMTEYAKRYAEYAHTPFLVQKK